MPINHMRPKKYERKLAKAKAKNDTKNIKKYEQYSQRSAKYDKGMENYARSLSGGKAAAGKILVGGWAQKTYAGLKGSGVSTAKSVGATVASLMLGPFGNTAVRSLAVKTNAVESYKNFSAKKTAKKAVDKTIDSTTGAYKYVKDRAKKNINS